MEYWKTQLDQVTVLLKGTYAQSTRFDSISVKLPSGLSPEDLKQCAFIDEKRNLILYGNVGTGKTHLAIALGIEACRKGLKVGFYRTANLVNQLSDAKRSGELSKLLVSIRKLDLLICDEWGYVPLDRGARLHHFLPGGPRVAVSRRNNQSSVLPIGSLPTARNIPPHARKPSEPPVHAPLVSICSLSSCTPSSQEMESPAIPGRFIEPTRNRNQMNRRNRAQDVPGSRYRFIQRSK